jgi:hypothetical protein
MTVGVDRSAVETALCGGGLGCPVAGCGGRLAPWGWAGPGHEVSVARATRFGCGRADRCVWAAGAPSYGVKGQPDTSCMI